MAETGNTPATTPAAALSGGAGLSARQVQVRSLIQALGMLPVLIILAVAFHYLTDQRFFSAQNVSIVAQQAAINTVLGAGMTFVILTGGIDLSVGSVLAASAMSALIFSLVPDLGWLGVPMALLTGLTFGLLNGALIAFMKLPPFIVTLGTMNIAFAATQLYSGAQTITDLPPSLTALGNTFSIGGTAFAWGTLLMLVLYALAFFLLRETAAGRHVYAVGDDPDAAQLSGVNVLAILISVYALSGLICAFAGWALIGRIGSVSPTSGAELNIQSITAVVIGGISLFGGRGSIVGALFGALIVGVFSLGLRLLGVDPQWTFFFIGVLIIVAVAVDQWIRKVAA